LWRTPCPRFGSLCETNIVPRNSEHHLFGIRVFHFVCNSARFLCAIARSLIRDTDVRTSRQAATASCWHAASQAQSTISPISQRRLVIRPPSRALSASVYALRWNFDYASIVLRCAPGRTWCRAPRRRRGGRDLERGCRGYRAAALHLCPPRQPGGRRERIVRRASQRAACKTLIQFTRLTFPIGSKLWS